MNIFVGNLSRDVTNDDLMQAFQAFGEVTSANVIRDKFTGDSRGFGFVEMPSREAAEAAIAGMNGKDLKGRAVNVNEARPRQDNRGPGGGGGRRFGGGGGQDRRPGGGGNRRPGGGGGGGRRY